MLHDSAVFYVKVSQAPVEVSAGHCKEFGWEASRVTLEHDTNAALLAEAGEISYCYHPPWATPKLAVYLPGKAPCSSQAWVGAAVGLQHEPHSGTIGHS